MSPSYIREKMITEICQLSNLFFILNIFIIYKRKFDNDYQNKVLNLIRKEF